MDYEEKSRLAQDEKTSLEILEELSRDEDWNIRYWIARNPSTPETALIRLSKDIGWGIRSYAIMNKSLGGILKEIARVRLGAHGKVDYRAFGYNRMEDRLFLLFLTDWEERYFHGL